MTHFDLIKEYVEEHYSNNAVLEEIGAPIEVGARNKVVLPFNAFYGQNQARYWSVVQWKAKFSGKDGYVISKKLDGVRDVCKARWRDTETVH